MKELIKRLLLVFLGIILALIIVEVSLRVFYKDQVVYSNTILPYNFSCYKTLPYYWVGLKPNSTCSFKSNANAFPDFTVRTNELGFRGPQLSKEKPHNTKRILFVGDSFTFGLGVKEDQAFPKQVEKILNSSQSAQFKYESINAGVPAAGPSYYYLLLKHKIADIKPNVIVVGLYLFNDVPGINYSEWKDLDSNGLPDKTESKIQYVNIAGELVANVLPLKFKTPYLRELHTFALTTDFLFPAKSGALKGPSGMLPEICLYKYFCHDLDDAKNKTKKLFLGMQDLAKKNNAKLLVIFVPSEYRANPYANEKYQLPPLLPRDRNYPYNEFSGFFDKNHVEYLRILPYLNAKDASIYYYKNDDHWNAIGHLVAAKGIAEKISKYFE